MFPCRRSLLLINGHAHVHFRKKGWGEGGGVALSSDPRSLFGKVRTFLFKMNWEKNRCPPTPFLSDPYLGRGPYFFSPFSSISCNISSEKGDMICEAPWTLTYQCSWYHQPKLIQQAYVQIETPV